MKKLLIFLFLSFLSLSTNIFAQEANYIWVGETFTGNTYRKINNLGSQINSFNSSSNSDIVVGPNEFLYIAAGGQIEKRDLNGSLIWNVSHPSGADSVAVGLDNYVYSGGDDSNVNKWDSGGNLEWTFTNHAADVKKVAVDYLNNVYSGGRDNTVRKIDSNGNQVWVFTGHTDFVEALAVDSELNVYSGGRDNTLRKIDSNGNQVWSFTSHTGFVNDIAVDINGFIYTASDDGTVRKIDSDGNEIWSFNDHTASVISIAVDLDGYVYSGGRDSKVYKIDSSGNDVWDFSLSSWAGGIATDHSIVYEPQEPPFYSVNLQTNTEYNDFIYIDDDINTTTTNVSRSIINDESFTVTSSATSTGSYTFNYWYDLDNMNVFTTDRNFTIEDPNRNYNLIADYTLDSFNTFNIDSNLPSPPDFELNTFTLEGQPLTINEYPFDNYQHPDDRAWEIIAPINNIGFYEFDYYYDNDVNDIYDFNHIITGSGFSPPNLTAVYSLPAEYQINLIIESNIGDIIFQHGNNDPISGPFISQTIGLGDAWTATAPNNSDYQFNNWADLLIGNVFSNNQTINITNTNRDYYLEATYFPLVDINWDSAGGTPIAQQKVIVGSSVQPPTEPIRPGFVFDYWEDSDNNEVSFPQTITEDVTFTAIWLETFTVDFQVNGGAPLPSQTVLENDTINVVTPSRFGYTFEGWYTDNVTFNNEFDFNTPIDQDDTLFAQWAFGTEDNAEQSLNVFLVDSNLDDPFAQIIIVLAFFVLLNAIIYVYSGPMIVTLILNFILTALFMVLGFIPFWIIIMIFIAIFGFALLMLFGGRSTA